MDCSDIISNIVGFDCKKKTAAGTSGKVYLINYADVDKASSIVVDNVVSQLVLKSGKYAYSAETADGNAVVGTATPNVGTYVTTVTHAVQMRLFIKDEATKAAVNRMLNARVVAIVENKDTNNPETHWEVYGYENGMKVSEGTITTEMTDGVVFDLTLSSTDNSTESSIAKSVWNTDTKTTEAMIEALVSTSGDDSDSVLVVTP